MFNTHSQLYLRLLLFISGLLGMVAFLLIRVGHVQLVKGEFYAELAQKNWQFTSVIPRERGLLLDRFGQPLVVNVARYSELSDPQALYSTSSSIDHEHALQLMATASARVGYSLERQYMAGESLSHVLGYTSAVSAEDLTADPELLRTDLIGKSGLERVFERQLRGKPGQAVYGVDAFGRKHQLLQETPAEAGQTITTTLDPFLSAVSHRALGGQKGAVVVLDAGTGAVLSLVSTPGYQPNDFSRQSIGGHDATEQQQRVKDQLSDERQRFFNRAVAGSYPPGSVFKIVTALAGLDSGAIKPSDTVLDEGVLKVGEYSYANWFYTQHGGTDGEIGMRRALARSNDIYFYKAAEWIGPNRLAEYSRRLLFGERPQIEVSGSAGLVPDPIWKEEVVGERWFLGNTYHFGIGQGDVQVSPLQVAQMTQAVANRGSMCPAHLTADKASGCQGLGIDDASMEEVVAGLLDACSSGGTGYPFFPWNAQYRDQTLAVYQQVREGAVACKTGTAEFGGQDARGFRRTHGWFTLFVNVERLIKMENDALAQTDAALSQYDPAYYLDRATWKRQLEAANLPTHLVVTVLVESDDEQPYREGSGDAAPVALEILEWMVGSAVPEGEVSEAEAIGD